MKLCIVAVLGIVLLAQSCGPKQIGQGLLQSNRKYKVDPYVDVKMSSTIDLEQIAQLPNEVDLKSDQTSIKNQGGRGACTFFSTIALVESVLKKEFSLEANFSEEYLAYTTKAIMGAFPRTDGSIPEYNVKALEKSGLILERDWAYQPSWFTRGLPCAGFKEDDQKTPLECYSHRSPPAEVLKKVIDAKSLAAVPVSRVTTDIIKYLAYAQRPMTFSLPFHDKGWPKTGDVFFNEELRAKCEVSPAECGRHSILMTGYNIEKKVFYFKNSWGSEWGHNGYGTVTFETVDLYAGPFLTSMTSVGEVKLPSNFKDDALALKDFEVKLEKRKDRSLAIKAYGEVTGASGRLVYASSYLVKKEDQAASEPNDKNVSLISLTPDLATKYNDKYVRSVYYKMPDSLNQTMSWNQELPIDLDFGSDLFENQNVQNIQSSINNQLWLRTSLYVYTDDVEWKVLKRIYSPY
jgi:hypothetical protein